MEQKNTLPKVALSIKQPWATLVILGLKPIEIRRWSTPFRGRIYIHAGRIADVREEGWSRVPQKGFALTNLRGGLVGMVDLVNCVTYGALREFRKDQQLHLNEPSWFLPPRMFGFQFAKPIVIPFRQMAGQVKMFEVPATPAEKNAFEPLKSNRKIVQFELESHQRRA